MVDPSATGLGTFPIMRGGTGPLQWPDRDIHNEPLSVGIDAARTGLHKPALGSCRAPLNVRRIERPTLTILKLMLG